MRHLGEYRGVIAIIARSTFTVNRRERAADNRPRPRQRGVTKSDLFGKGESVTPDT